MRSLFALVLTAMVFLGCARVPFKTTPPVPMQGVDSLAMRATFAESLPKQFKVLNSIVFKRKGRSLAFIGYTTTNADDRSYQVVCLNHVGVKLIEFEGKADKFTSRYVLGDLAALGDVSRVVAEDIQRVYFDRVPSPNAEVIRKDKSILFRQNTGSDRTEYIFSGKDRFLTEKRFYQGRRLAWKVSYYEYRNEKGCSFPKGIVLKNYIYNYELVVHLREVR